MEWLIPVLLLAVGLVLIIKGGDFFVDSATWIAEASGIPKFIIGATVVSLATTLPEQIVSVIGALQKSEEGIAVATGNAVGSVTANTGLILAVSIICLPAVINRKEYLFKSLLLCLTTALLWWFGFKTDSTGGHVLSFVGSILLGICFVAFIIENVRSAKRQITPDTERVASDKKTVILNILRFIVGIAGIVIGADLLVDNATLLATALGVPAAVISATIVAIGTSLPELITTITAVIKKQSELSVGNIIGANIIDIAVILPLCSLISGREFPVSYQNLILDMPFCLLTCLIAVVPMLVRGKLTRPQGVFLLCVYIVYLLCITVFLHPVGLLFGVPLG